MYLSIYDTGRKPLNVFNEYDKNWLALKIIERKNLPFTGGFCVTSKMHFANILFLYLIKTQRTIEL